MISSSSLFEIINVDIPDAKTFFWLAAFVAAAAVNSNGIKMLLAIVLSVFFIKINQFLVMVQEGYQEILPTVPS